MAIETSDIAVEPFEESDELVELRRKLSLLSELILAIQRDLASLDARVTALEP